MNLKTDIGNTLNKFVNAVFRGRQFITCSSGLSILAAKRLEKKIDVAWQFQAAVIDYVGVGVKKTRLKYSPKTPCPPQAWSCNAAREPLSAGLPPFFGGLLCRVGGGANFIVLEERL
jgi:hypothetical protein